MDTKSKPIHQAPSPGLWGYADAHAGLPIDDNPYERSTKGYEDWKRGWILASMEDV
jgi:hypothetical protein